MNSAKPITPSGLAGWLIGFQKWRAKYIDEKTFLLIISGLVGVLSGLAAVLLKTSVHFLQLYLKSILTFADAYRFELLLPLFGIMITVVISRYIFKDHPGHGITMVIYAISKNSGIIKKTLMYSRMITSAITVGFGGSVGLEGPIVVNGSAFGSNLGTLFNFDYKKRILLIGCGAAGAISAIFNSPIAGVIFAIEVLLTDITISKFIPILIASVAGQLVSIILIGEDILFAFNLTESFEAREIHYYIILGLVCGISSLYFTRVIFWVEERIEKQSNKIIRGLKGGLGLTLLIILLPDLYGEGYDTIKDLLNGKHWGTLHFNLFHLPFSPETLILITMIMILIAKPIATALTIASGGSGGIFAPSMFMGGITGFFTAYLLNMLIPGLNLSLSIFTLVGMAGVMSGVFHAPLTGIFLIAEITGGYNLFVPLMLVSAISYTTISRFEEHSIYTKHLIQSGDFIPYDKDRQVLNLITLNKIIEKDILTILPEATLGELVQKIKTNKRNIFVVIDQEGKLEGIITLDDIREIMFDSEKQKTVTVGSLMSDPPAFITLNEEMNSVMNKFETSQAWNLPMVSEEGKYIGFISKSTIFNVYREQLIHHSNE